MSTIHITNQRRQIAVSDNFGLGRYREQVQERQRQEMERAQLDAYAMLIHGIEPNRAQLSGQIQVQSTGGSMIDKLKTLHNWIGKGDTHPVVDSLVELAAYGRMLRQEYEFHEIPVPKWLRDALDRLKGEIRARWRVEQEAKLRAAEKELEQLRSREEKKEAKEQEIERLRKELGL